MVEKAAQLQRIGETGGRGSSMHWFRSKSRSSARLALLALALQMIVSFGHIHRDDLGLPPLGGSGQTQVASSAAAPSAAPTDKHQQPASDDYCPICASIALLATAMPALPPVIVMPEPIERIWPSIAPLDAPAPRLSLSFQARAPPAA